jgi:hypothetical protein
VKQLALVVCGLSVAFAAAQTPGATTTVFTGARVLDVADGRYQPAAAVVVTGGRIAAIHATMPAALPEGAQRVDLAGATLVPGLGDMAITAAPRGSLAADYFYLASLAWGVTMVRTIDVPAQWGTAQRDRVNAGEILGPLIWTSGPPLEQRGIDRRARGDLDAAGFRDWAGAARATELQARAKVDWIRVRGNVSADGVRAIVASARAGGVRVSGEALSTPMAQMAQLGVRALDGLGVPGKSLDEIEKDAAQPLDVAALSETAWEQARPDEIKGTIAALLKAKTVLVTMLDRDALRVNPAELAKRPDVAALPETVRTAVAALAAKSTVSVGARKVRELQSAFVRDFATAGGTIVIGTAAGPRGFPAPGAGVHAEIARLVAAGLAPAAAIRSATVVPAAFAGAEKTSGQIKPGFSADFFAVDGDPLAQVSDLARIRLVVRNGEVLDRKNLLAMTERAAAGR